jgi:5-methyltetrahydropteroyltriglutamate--homocysteine methyltransferase
MWFSSTSPPFNVYTEEVTEWEIAALRRAAEDLPCMTAVHICYGYGIKANIDWKSSLGAEWRQYEAIFPSLASLPRRHIANPNKSARSAVALCAS